MDAVNETSNPRRSRGIATARQSFEAYGESVEKMAKPSSLWVIWDPKMATWKLEAPSFDGQSPNFMELEIEPVLSRFFLGACYASIWKETRYFNRMEAEFQGWDWNDV